ncbi:MAG TPA: flagellar hook-length control protein FliK [Rectinemataceae bacterium]|nr:flagellar hook-length control protein FliK [Rectinemataceae bacterium]
MALWPTRSVPTIGDIAKVAPAAAGQAHSSDPAGAAAGAWSKTGQKKGLSSLFAAFFGKALSGAKAQAGEGVAGKQGVAGVKAGLVQHAGKEGPKNAPTLPARETALPVEKKAVAKNETAKPLASGQLPSRLLRADGGATETQAHEEGSEGPPGPRKAGKRKDSSAPAQQQQPEGLSLLAAGAQSARVQQDRQVKTEREEFSSGISARKAETDRGKAQRGDDPGLSARIQVLDQRRLSPKSGVNAGEEGGEAKAVQPKHVGSGPEEARADHDLFLDLSRAATASPTGKDGPAREVATGQNFAAVLADRLRDSGNTEIVQSARIVLKDGDSGTIRMRLNPPELGHVKIELHLADNNISGKIVVESDAARSAFEKGLASLHDAFRSGGFESAKLEVQVGGGNAQGQGARNGDGRGGEGPPAPFWSERSRTSAFEPGSAAMASRASRAGRAVDIVV